MRLFKLLATAVFTLSVVLCAPLSFADAPAAAERFEIGSMLVEKHGDHGTPLILIPGLASGAWVWRDTVAKFKQDHVLYVVTLAGFDGRPAVGGNLMAQAEQSLLDLIAARKLDKPVLIGHSLGGTLSIQFAERHSDLLSGVVTVDGLAVFPGTEATPLAQRPQLGKRMKAQLAGLSAEAFAAQQLKYMRSMGVLDEGRAQELAALTDKSDPVATAQYVAEDIALDLRQDLSEIKVPLLVISPYSEADFAARRISESDKMAYYKALTSGAPRLEVVSIAPARHFAMFDQPKVFGDVLANYLKSLRKPA